MTNIGFKYKRATNRPENIVIRRNFIISEVANLQHFHFSQLA
jgi:hypothetical protein